MKLSVLLLFVFNVVFFLNLNGQDTRTFDNALIDIHRKMQALDATFTSNDLDDNPEATVIADNEQLLELVIQKGDMAWQKHKFRQGVRQLIQSYKAYNAGVNALEILAKNGKTKDRERVIAKKLNVYEGCIRATLEGYNFTGGLPMFERSVEMMERYNRLIGYLNNRGSTEILERKDLPKLFNYFQYLKKEKRAMVEYFVGNEMIYSTITWGGAVNMSIISDKKKVFANINKLQNSMKEVPAESMLSSNLKDFSEASLVLNQMLLNHALKSIPDSITSIVIIPDNELTAIPFDLLSITANKEEAKSFGLEDQDYVSEHFQINYAKSSMDMLSTVFPSDEETKKNKMAILNDPTKKHPSQWKSLLPKFEDKAVVAGRASDSDVSNDGNNKMIYFGLGILVAIALYFFSKRRSASS